MQQIPLTVTVFNNPGQDKLTGFVNLVQTKKLYMQQLGKYIITGGIILIIAGLIIYFAGNKLNWLGRLPGDIRIERENFRFYFPVTTMILISVVASAILYLIRRFL